MLLGLLGGVRRQKECHQPEMYLLDHKAINRNRKASREAKNHKLKQSYDNNKRLVWALRAVICKNQSLGNRGIGWTYSKHELSPNKVWTYPKQCRTYFKHLRRSVLANILQTERTYSKQMRIYSKQENEHSPNNAFIVSNLFQSHTIITVKSTPKGFYAKLPR